MNLNDIKKIVRRTLENELHFQEYRLMNQRDEEVINKYLGKAKTAVSVLRSLPNCEQFTDFSEYIAQDIVRSIIDNDTAKF